MIFVCGRFDILHPGHVYLLKTAESLCDIKEPLHVYINSDASCRKLGKPALMDENDRFLMVHSLKIYDEISLFDETDAREIVRKISPRIWVIGDDHENEDFSNLRCQMFFVKRTEHSSSAIKEKIKCQ